MKEKDQPKKFVPVIYHKDKKCNLLIEKLNEETTTLKSSIPQNKLRHNVSRKAQLEMLRYKRMPKELRERVNKLSEDHTNNLTRSEIVVAANNMLNE